MDKQKILGNGNIQINGDCHTNIFKCPHNKSVAPKALKHKIDVKNRIIEEFKYLFGESPLSQYRWETTSKSDKRIPLKSIFISEPIFDQRLFLTIKDNGIVYLEELKSCFSTVSNETITKTYCFSEDKTIISINFGESQVFFNVGCFNYEDQTIEFGSNDIPLEFGILAKEFDDKFAVRKFPYSTNNDDIIFVIIDCVEKQVVKPYLQYNGQNVLEGWIDLHCNRPYITLQINGCEEKVENDI